MKFLLVIVVVGAVLWIMFGKSRREDEVRQREAPKAPQVPQQMLACAHCGVHLPEADAVRDGAGRSYCGEAHRLAGPRQGG